MTQPPVFTISDIIQNTIFTFHRGFVYSKEDFIRYLDEPDFRRARFHENNTALNIIKGSQIPQNSISQFNYIINPEQMYLALQEYIVDVDLSKPILKIFRFPKDKDSTISENVIIQSPGTKMSGGYYTKYQKYVEKFKLKF
jgi:hypothetical protein